LATPPLRLLGNHLLHFTWLAPPLSSPHLQLINSLVPQYKYSLPVLHFPLFSVARLSYIVLLCCAKLSSILPRESTLDSLSGFRIGHCLVWIPWLARCQMCSPCSSNLACFSASKPNFHGYSIRHLVVLLGSNLSSTRDIDGGRSHIS